jgi:nucleoside-triphosphatase THEP1
MAAGAEADATDMTAPASPERPLFMALVYDDGPAFDGVFAGLARDLRDRGLRLAGVVQSHVARADRRRCDMVVEELSVGTRETISEDRGDGARGCRLDTAALGRMLVLVERSLDAKPDLLLVNKFGKEEAEGRGLRGAIAQAVERGIPVVIGVPRRNLDAFSLFSGGLAEEKAPEALDASQLVDAVRSRAPAASSTTPA